MTTPSVLGERYEIGGVLGRGGMAEVHRGRDTRLGREIAVKVLRSDLARDPSAQVRFRREAQASASLNHPAIVAVYDTGEDRTATGATPYIVMELVEGETLRDLLRREGPLDPVRAMSLTADICAALDFSHRNGIVHRDVKPGNVMITPQGTVKVMDFGIARAVSDSAATMTSTAAVIGTAQYLSPEQARGEGVDARSDVYSCGCLLYELVTGTPPFTGDSPVAVAYQHVREDPKTPSSLNPAIPASLDAVLLKAMSKNPANRYQSAADMRADLLRAVAGQQVEATPVMSENERTALIGAVPGDATRYAPAADGNDDYWDDEADAERRKKRVLITSIIGALLVIAVVVGLLVLLNGGGDKSSDTPTASTTTAPAQVVVPADLAGMSQSEAEAAIETAGLTVGTEDKDTSDTVDKGDVISSTPASGSMVDPNTPVDLVVSSGPDAVTVPNVVGQSVADATDYLQSSGFTGNINTEQVSSLKDEGTVVTVTPDVGEDAAPDDTITLGVSMGTVSVPDDLVGKSESAARSALKKLGLSDSQIETSSAQTDDYDEGDVAGVSTSTGNDTVGADDTVTLQIAEPNPATEAPTTTSSAPTTTSAAPTS